MEIILGLIGLLFAISVVLEKATQFLKNLKNGNNAKLKNGFQVSLSVLPIDKKREHVLPTQNSNNNTEE